MKDLNRVTIHGRVTQSLNDRSYAVTASGVPRLSFSVAVNSPKKTQNGYEDEASFFDVELWGKQADGLRGYISKGKEVIVDGSLKQERWQDKETGRTRSAVKIRADYVQLLGGKKESENLQGGNVQNAPRDFQDDFPDDLPF